MFRRPIGFHIRTLHDKVIVCNTKVVTPKPRHSRFFGERSRPGCCSVRLAPNIGGVAMSESSGNPSVPQVFG
jgi:hypothetical protein